MSNSATRVIVGLSGGVDSSVTAYLLQQQGFDVQALFMKNWEEDDTSEHCAASQDIQDCERVCEHLKIPLHIVNFSREYWQNVFESFLQEYASGRTPNPDILCNQMIKFDSFLKHAKTLGAEVIATGHYAQKTQQQGYYMLQKALDPAKDQTYFLHRLNQAQLAASLFPLGKMHKTAVRQLAQQLGLATYQKKDSTGICFIGERKFKTFLQSYLPAQPGIIVDITGKELGKHEGVIYYTIGQRQGIGIGGQIGSSGEPWYVADKDLQTNTLIVVQGKQHPRLYRRELTFSNAHWVAGKPADLPLPCTAKIRYRQIEQACLVTPGNAADTFHVAFTDPQWAVTPGQAIVLYQGENCLGGGFIQ